MYVTFIHLAVGYRVKKINMIFAIEFYMYIFFFVDIVFAAVFFEIKDVFWENDCRTHAYVIIAI